MYEQRQMYTAIYYHYEEDLHGLPRLEVLGSGQVLCVLFVIRKANFVTIIFYYILCVYPWTHDCFCRVLQPSHF